MLIECYISGIQSSGGKDIEDQSLYLGRNQFANLVSELKMDSNNDNNSNLLNSLGQFLEQTQEVDKDKINCRREFRGLFWELGCSRQSALGRAKR